MITLIEFWPRLGIGLRAQAEMIKTEIGIAMIILN